MIGVVGLDNRAKIVGREFRGVNRRNRANDARRANVVVMLVMIVRRSIRRSSDHKERSGDASEMNDRRQPEALFVQPRI